MILSLSNCSFSEFETVRLGTSDFNPPSICLCFTKWASSNKHQVKFSCIVQKKCLGEFQISPFWNSEYELSKKIGLSKNFILYLYVLLDFPSKCFLKMWECYRTCCGKFHELMINIPKTEVLLGLELSGRELKEGASDVWTTTITNWKHILRARPFSPPLVLKTFSDHADYRPHYSCKHELQENKIHTCIHTLENNCGISTLCSNCSTFEKP